MWLKSHGPPTDNQAAQVRAIVADLPRFMQSARSYLLTHEDCAWLKGGAGEFQPYGIELEGASSFVLELVHPSDPDGVYRVTFREGEPVACGRDD